MWITEFKLHGKTEFKYDSFHFFEKNITIKKRLIMFLVKIQLL